MSKRVAVWTAVIAVSTMVVFGVAVLTFATLTVFAVPTEVEAMELDSPMIEEAQPALAQPPIPQDDIHAGLMPATTTNEAYPAHDHGTYTGGCMGKHKGETASKEL